MVSTIIMVNVTHVFNSNNVNRPEYKLLEILYDKYIYIYLNKRDVYKRQVYIYIGGIKLEVSRLVQ